MVRIRCLRVFGSSIQARRGEARNQHLARGAPPKVTGSKQPGARRSQELLLHARTHAGPLRGKHIGTMADQITSQRDTYSTLAMSSLRGGRTRHAVSSSRV